MQTPLMKKLSSSYVFEEEGHVENRPRNNQKKINQLPIPEKYEDPLLKMMRKAEMRKGMSLEDTRKVVKQQGKFGMVDDDETMGSSPSKFNS